MAKPRAPTPFQVSHMKHTKALAKGFAERARPKSASGRWRLREHSMLARLSPGPRASAAPTLAKLLFTVRTTGRDCLCPALAEDITLQPVRWRRDLR
jgi:hypothetical protein